MRRSIVRTHAVARNVRGAMSGGVPDVEDVGDAEDEPHHDRRGGHPPDTPDRAPRRRPRSDAPPRRKAPGPPHFLGDHTTVWSTTHPRKKRHDRHEAIARHGRAPRSDRHHRHGTAAGGAPDHGEGPGAAGVSRPYTIHVRRPGDVVVAKATVPPGASFGWHYHRAAVVVVVRSGTLTLYDGADRTCSPARISAGHGFVEQRNHVHLARNEGRQARRAPRHLPRARPRRQPRRARRPSRQLPVLARIPDTHTPITRTVPPCRPPTSSTASTSTACPATIDAVNGDPALARFQFRARNRVARRRPQPDDHQGVLRRGPGRPVAGGGVRRRQRRAARAPRPRPGAERRRVRPPRPRQLPDQCANRLPRRRPRDRDRRHRLHRSRATSTCAASWASTDGVRTGYESIRVSFRIAGDFDDDQLAVLRRPDALLAGPRHRHEPGPRRHRGGAVPSRRHGHARAPVPDAGGRDQSRHRHRRVPWAQATDPARVPQRRVGPLSGAAATPGRGIAPPRRGADTQACPPPG